MNYHLLHVLLSSVLACGGIYNESSGILRSPSYSYSNYPNNLYCVYSLHVSSSRVIIIRYIRKKKENVFSSVHRKAALLTDSMSSHGGLAGI